MPNVKDMTDAAPVLNHDTITLYHRENIARRNQAKTARAEVEAQISRLYEEASRLDETILRLDGAIELLDGLMRHRSDEIPLRVDLPLDDLPLDETPISVTDAPEDIPF